jgi:hypothetical protein
MFAIMELLYGTWGGGKGKENARVNNIEMHYACADRGHNSMY